MATGREKGGPKRVTISSLAARFSKADGWTEELLRAYLIQGDLYLNGYGQYKDQDPYWILPPGGKIDFQALIADGHVGEVGCKEYWHETRGLSDLEALEKRNW